MSAEEGCVDAEVIKKTQDNYDRNYKNPEHFRYDLKRERGLLARNIIPYTKWDRGDRISELGCGQGLHACTLAAMGFYNVIGFELSSKGYERCVERSKAWEASGTITSGHVSFVQADVAGPDVGPADHFYVRGLSWYHYQLDGSGVFNVPKLTAELFKKLRTGGTFTLQIITNFSGNRPTNAVHDNRVGDYLDLFEPLGEVVRISNWDGNVLTREGPNPKGSGVTIITRKRDDE